MKNKIDELFERKEKNILSIYTTAGFPQLNDTTDIIRSLESNGVDLIEIGIPYSDPLADGPVIQDANQIAIENGMNLKLLFEQLDSIKNEIQTPIILMGYLNVIMQFGVEQFYYKCQEVNVSGVIIPDLPLDEYERFHKPFASSKGIKNIFLITPKTSIERIKLIDNLSDPFIYVVSSNSITGNDLSGFDQLEVFYDQLRSLQLKNKTLIGFGINNANKFNKACKLANGAIIGSAFIQSIKNKTTIPDFIHSIRQTQTLSV